MCRTMRQTDGIRMSVRSVLRLYTERTKDRLLCRLTSAIRAVDSQASARQPRRNANPHNANCRNWQQCGLVNAGRTTPAKSGRKHLLQGLP